MKQTVFVTGATGLLGRDILNCFHQAGYTIIALKRTHSNNNELPNEIQWITGDLIDSFSYQDALQQADFVIHAGAMVNFSGKYASSMIQFNQRTTETIVNLCLEHNKPLLYVSSIATLTNSPIKKVLTEEDEFDENALFTAYAKSKHLAEMEVWRGIAEGLSATIVNPGIILGTPTIWNRSTGLIWMSLKKALPIYPTGKTGYIDGRDVAQCLLKLYENNQFGERFILVAEQLNYQEVFQLLMKQMGETKRIYPIPKMLASILWRSSEFLKKLGLTPSYTKATHQALNSQQLYSSEKIKDRLQVQFIPIEDSFQRMTNAFLDQRK